MNKTVKYNSPSGQILLYNYKEPLMPNDPPFVGYKGVLIHDAEKEAVQCSVCGKWFKFLGVHIRVHRLTSKKYKEMFGLSNESSLICEELREKFIANGKDRVMPSNMEKIKGKRHPNWRHYDHISMEQRNINGTCPLQLLDKLKKIKEEMGRQPSHNEVKRLYSPSLCRTIIKVYGSWNNAIEKLGWVVQPSGVGFGQNRWTADKLIQVIIDFQSRYKREPMSSDIRRGLLPSQTLFMRHFGGFKNAKMIANTL